MGQWVSPTGYVDPDAEWTNEANAYDGNAATYAYSEVVQYQWGHFLELTVASLECNSLRFDALYLSPVISAIDLDVYYSGAWHHVYEGAFLNHMWVEKALGSTQDVTAMRCRFKNDFMTWDAELYEAEFYDTSVTIIEKDVIEGIKVGESVTKLAHKVTAEGIVIDEVVSKLTARVYAEGIVIDEAVSKLASKVYTEGIVIGETVTKLAHKITAEGIVIGETVSKLTSRIYAEGIAIGEAVSSVRIKVRSFTEGIAIGEVVSKQAHKVAAEGIAIGEVVIKMRVIKSIRKLSPFRLLDNLRNKLKGRQL